MDHKSSMETSPNSRGWSYPSKEFMGHYHSEAEGTLFCFIWLPQPTQLQEESAQRMHFLSIKQTYLTQGSSSFPSYNKHDKCKDH